MPRTDSVYELPGNLPIPVDDGASDHLLGMRLPSVPRVLGQIQDIGILLSPAQRTWQGGRGKQ